MSRLRPIVIVSFICASLVGWALARGDEGPALHYDFGQAGEVATDISGHGNDGRIVKAVVLDEVAGRRGVLRLDGKSSFLNCGSGDSLRLSGDFTLEFWLRVNDPVQQGGTLIACGRAFQLYAMRTIMADYRTGDDQVRLTLGKTADCVGSGWTHVALVVEYPRMRLFCNGELICDAYMPIPGVFEPEPAARIVGQRCAIDIDEMRLYRRALGSAEVVAHSHGEEVRGVREFELAVEPDWYERGVALRLSCKGVDPAGCVAEMALLGGDRAPVFAPARSELAEPFANCGRYTATTRFPLNGIEGKSLDGTARILRPDGTVIATVLRHVSLDKPDWIENREGYPVDVPPPWTPVEVAPGPEGVVEVRVWGRHHHFTAARPFPDQIETGGVALLSSPIVLRGQADGKPIVWASGRLEIQDTTRMAATVKQDFEADPLALKAAATIEYDGYMIFDCVLQARRDANVESLLFEIPLVARYAGLCFGTDVYPEKTDPPVPMSALHMGAVRGDLSFRFSPNVWLGDEERGLCWQAESDECWRCADQQKAIEVLPRGETTIFRAHWVDTPVRLVAGETLRYRFALQATPVRPLLRDAWDLRIIRSDPYAGPSENPDLNLPDRYVKRDHVKADRIYSVVVDELNLFEPGPDRVPALEYYAEMGARHLWINVHDNWPWPWPRDKKFAAALRRLVDCAHAHGLRVYDYLIHERMPTDVPEYDLYGFRMSSLPLAPYEATVGFCAKSRALQDAVIYNLARRLNEYGDDGVYLDGTTVHFKPCRNLAHGCGYRAADAAGPVRAAVEFDQTDRGFYGSDRSVHTTYPVFANREMMKRIYTVVKSRRPDGVIDVHSWYLNPACLAYADILWTGEQWWHLRGKGTNYVAGELTLDIFRTAFTGLQIGVAAETLPYRLIGNTQKNSQVAATSLLHDIPVRIRTQDTEWFDIMSKLWKLRERFGMKEAEKLYYWMNGDFVRLSPEKCYATLFRHPRNGVLAFISNLRTDAATVKVEFNLDALGLRDAKLEAFNALSGEPLVLRDGSISLPLGSEEWAYVWLRPTGWKD